ncbi:hypothetical protein CsSME_00009493 [Camellia sinensis var. sinensis]
MLPTPKSPILDRSITISKETKHTERVEISSCRCLTTTWRSKTWNGTTTFKPSPIHVPAETCFRSQNKISTSAKTSLDALAVPSTSLLFTTSKISFPIHPRRRISSPPINSPSLSLDKPNRKFTPATIAR